MRWFIEATIAAVALVILSPFFLILILLVWFDVGRPVVYYQERAGKDGVPFRIFKFRSMKDLADERGEPLPDEDRITRWGALMRSASLDELPQLLNVVRGEMRFVGPRPLPTSYTPLFNDRQATRLQVTPGITAWTSVNGRNTTTWEERFELDAWYVENRSLWLDIKILARTVTTVLKREGVSAEGHVTMPPFRPSQQPEADEPRGQQPL